MQPVYRSALPALLAALAGLLLVALPATAAPSLTGGAPDLYLVFFDDAPADLPAVRAKAARGRSAEATAALARVEARQAERLVDLETTLARRLEPRFRYRAATNGVALELTAREAARIAKRPGVRAVVRDHAYTLDSDAGPAWVAAPAVWSGDAVPALAATRGEGVVVGVLDSGVNMDHPSFGDAPPDGHVYANPYGAGVHLGWCDPAHPRHDPAYVCNDKLVGAWDFADDFGFESDGPEDGLYHGSHVAAIAVGNALAFPPVSGVAPHAHLVSYDVCYGSPGTCRASAVAAAIDQAVVDGVDVLNVSLGGGGSPWFAGDMDAFLRGAVAAGITVVGSAGNSGPTAGSVGHRAPWVLSVGAASHHRVADRNLLADLAGGAAAPPADLEGLSLTDGYGPAPIVDGGACEVLAPGTFAGEIVVCDAPAGRAFAWAPCQRVADAGGGACVLLRPDGATSFADFHALPAIDLDDGPGSPLRAWLASGAGHQGRITATEVVTDPALGDRLAAFSSRGPNPAADVLKPDLVAPGTGVLSAFRSGLLPVYRGPEFLTSSGTSMASPHVAGAAALLVAVHPEWTPAEIAAALVTTAADGVTFGGVPADSFARGAGRLDVAAAAAATLVLDETDACYAAADPAAGGDPASLNVASLVASDCAGVCAWTRTVENATDEVMRWTATVDVAGLDGVVSPARFVLPPGHTKPITVAVAARPGADLGAWATGTVALVPDDPTRPVTRLPVAVRPSATATCCLPGDRSCKGKPCDLPNPHRARACESGS